jgi:hypothetical protein
MRNGMSKTTHASAPHDGTVAPQVLHFDRVQPDRDEIVRLTRLQPGRDAHRRWFELMDKLLADFPRLMRPRAVYRIDEVAALEARRIVLKSGTVFDGALGAFLKHSTLLVTYVVTIGSALERLARGWLRSGRVMQGTIADAIASEAVEAVGQRLYDELRTWAHARGLELTPPYSPGYCGMTVRQQIPLFASLPAARINVRLTPSCLMLPIKSVSGLIGIGPADRIAVGGTPCEACDHPDCVQRRVACDRTRFGVTSEEGGHHAPHGSDSPPPRPSNAPPGSA